MPDVIDPIEVEKEIKKLYGKERDISKIESWIKVLEYRRDNFLSTLKDLANVESPEKEQVKSAIEELESKIAAERGRVSFLSGDLDRDNEKVVKKYNLSKSFSKLGSLAKKLSAAKSLLSISTLLPKVGIGILLVFLLIAGILVGTALNSRNDLTRSFDLAINCAGLDVTNLKDCVSGITRQSGEYIINTAGSCGATGSACETE